MRRLFIALGLLLRFFRMVAAAGWQTVRVILRTRRGASSRSGFARVPFAPLTPGGAALLGCMVTLTPGSTLIDIDMERHEMLLHVLDMDALDAMADGVRRELEPALVALFPAASP